MKEDLDTVRGKFFDFLSQKWKRWKIIAEELAFENDNQVGRTAEEKAHTVKKSSLFFS